MIADADNIHSPRGSNKAERKQIQNRRDSGCTWGKSRVAMNPSVLAHN